MRQILTKKQLMYQGILFVVLLIVLLCFNSVKSAEFKNMYEIPEKCNFESITELLSDNPCTPKLTDSDFQGIVINGPKQVTYTDNMIGESPFDISQINLSCILNLKYDLLNLNGRFVYQVLFVAVDKATSQVYSGKMRTETTIVDNVFDGTSGISIDDFKDVLVTEYFNPNLVEVLNLPAKEAEYVVYATLANFKSNAISITVSKKK